MKRHSYFSSRRIAAFFFIGALGLLAVGDRAFTAVARGIDPLDTLDRTAKPNVILVLDSSESMRNSPYFNGGVGPGTGDWSFSKMAVAKQTLSTMIANNQSRANFMLASFQQSNAPAFSTTASRFFYVLSSTAAAPPFAPTPFSLSTWQDIQAGWNTLYWTEASGASISINPTFTIGTGANDKFYFRELIASSPSHKFRTCTVTLSGLHATYNTDAQMNSLATGLTNLLRSGNAFGGSCVGDNPLKPDNDYTVTWAGSPTFRFTITRTGPTPYQLLVDNTTASILDNLGIATTPDVTPAPALTTTNPGTSANYTTAAAVTGSNISVAQALLGATCKAPVSTTFFANGSTLAIELAKIMNDPAVRSCSNGVPANTYGVSFNSGSGQFTFTCDTTASLGPPCLTNFTINWQTGTPNNIAGALGKGAATDATTNLAVPTNSLTSGSLSTLADYQGASSQTTDLIGGTTRTNYVVSAGRFFNGQTLGVDTAGTVCSITPGSAVTPPTLIVQPLQANCGANNGAAYTLTLEGANWGDDVAGAAGVPGTGSCSGYQSVVNLVACNTGTPQTATFANALSPGLVLGGSSPFTPPGYTEATNGSYAVTSTPSPLGMIAFESATPLASAINGVRGAFNTLYSSGNFGLTAISSHNLPHERTIVVLITDGNDTCAIDGGAATDNNALAAAYQAQLLYFNGLSGGLNADGTFTVGTDPASSVTTYVVGFGNGINTTIDTNHLNWIAWGGSGLGSNSSPTVTNNGTRWTATPTQAQREVCATCSDAYIALDGPALSTVLQSVIDQATSSEGTFSATQAIQASPFELAALVPAPPAPAPPNSSLNPKIRYDVLAPLGFESVFTMPGFRGTVRAISNQSGTPTVFWDGGQKLLTSIQASMNLVTAAAADRPSGIQGELSFQQLHGNATAISSSTTGVGIKRRIYTSAGNGAFPVVDNNFSRLFAGGSPCRVALWPPNSAPDAPTGTCLGSAVVAPANDASEGLLDVALGLPSDAAIGSGATALTQFNNLQTQFEVCVATPPASAAPSASCSDPTDTTDVLKAKRARREARELILAYVAGASVVLDTAGYPKRASAAGAAWAKGDILFHSRPWVMAESTLSSAAVIGPPIEVTPGTTGFVAEYNLYRDGLPANRNSSQTAVNGLAQGFGLRNPDKDDAVSAPSPGDDSRTTLKPVMTAVYVGANDMLHAFRAGPNCNTPGTGNYSACAEPGGEELWGFVPFDRLGVMRNLLKPQTRGNKTYVVASGVRFADAFVQHPGGNFSATIGGAPVSGRGVWRQILTFGRGQGGKYYTVLDVTGRKAFTGLALDTPPPIVLWNRGNPDTVEGTSGGTAVRAADTTAYSKMGETWAVPAISFVDEAQNNGTSVVLYTGSGYGDSANSGEGAFFYTLDALTGNVIGSIDVEAAASAAGVSRTGLSYPNALVAGPAAFSGIQLTPLQAGHPSEITTRVFFGDLHGRLWKVNSAAPSTAVLMADLGVGQPVGVPPSLIALGSPVKPYIYLASGNDSRATGPFKIFGFSDDSGSDTNASPGTRTPSSAPAPLDDTTVFEYPPQSKSLFVRAFPEASFRGTIQPATAFTTGSPVNGRVFFGGTRFIGFGSAFAPAPFPCLATFDTVIFALGAETGGAAYDLNASGDDAFLVFSNSRKLAIQVIRQPGATSSSTAQPAKLYLDEGLMSGATSPNPPAPPGYAAAIVPQPPSVTLTLRSGTAQSVFPQFAAPRICQ